MVSFRWLCIRLNKLNPPRWTSSCIMATLVIPLVCFAPLSTSCRGSWGRWGARWWASCRSTAPLFAHFSLGSWRVGSTRCWWGSCWANISASRDKKRVFSTHSCCGGMLCMFTQTARVWEGQISQIENIHFKINNQKKRPHTQIITCAQFFLLPLITHCCFCWFSSLPPPKFPSLSAIFFMQTTSQYPRDRIPFHLFFLLLSVGLTWRTNLIE